MIINFWGVRGSIPTPGKKFIKYGGNTSCVELSIENQVIIFDMGSGIKNLGDNLIKKNIKEFNIFMSHFHYDHTCGLPFFKPAYNSKCSFTINAGIIPNKEKALAILNKQICSPSFPITINDFKANVHFNDFVVGEDIYLMNDKIKIMSISLNHPDGAVGYRVQYENKSICYITDHEHLLDKKDINLIKFIDNTDVLIYDSTYQDEEFDNYIGWGHSTWQQGARIAKEANVENYFIFHHNPDNDDNVMETIEKKSKKIYNNIEVAKEGMSFSLL